MKRSKERKKKDYNLSAQVWSVIWQEKTLTLKVQFHYFSMFQIFKTVSDVQGPSPITHSITDLTNIFCYGLAYAYVPH